MKKIERILKYIENQGLSLSTFERDAGLGYSYLGKTRDRGADVTLKVLDKIRINAPEHYYKIFPEEKEGANHIEEHEPGYKAGIEGVAELELLRQELEQLRASLQDKDALIRSQQKIIELQERMLHMGDGDNGDKEEKGKRSA